MQDNIGRDISYKQFSFFLVGIIFFILLLGQCNVYGYSGTGSKNNPYVINTESELKKVLSEKGKSSWVYIAVNQTISLTNTIKVPNGKFRIYAKNADRTIKRSSDLNAMINDKENPKYCMRLNGNAQVVFGYPETKYILKLGGMSSVFTEKRECSGWLYISEKASVVLDKNSHMLNMKNNKKGGSGSPVFCRGKLIVRGEISNSEGIDGGAIKVQQGILVVHDGAEIHDCKSSTEGGSIYGYELADVTINGGKIYNCTAAEEGGAVFVSDESVCKIYGGTLKNNNSGGTGGAVFTGYGATLYVGKESGVGPEILNNTSSASGGGIRCNGGIGDNSGGKAYFYGGKVSGNHSEKNGGGICCGKSGLQNNSIIYLRNMDISNNTSRLSGAGLWLPSEAIGSNNTRVIIESCLFRGNVSKRSGGGLLLKCKASVIDSKFDKNMAEQNGGAVCIDREAILLMKNSIAFENVSNIHGRGIYVEGKLEFSEETYISDENEVYLTKDTYIEIVGKLLKKSGYIANIEPEIKANGTRLIKAGYVGTSATEELYYKGRPEDEYKDKKTIKKFKCLGLKQTQCIRPSEQVNNYEDYWIIISEKYKIKYDKNTEEVVQNMPETQVKFWSESIYISSNVIKRNGTVIDDIAHWNFASEGHGSQIKPGAIYNYNGTRVLYARWKEPEITRIDINATDRFFLVGQKITLNKKELLKRVTVEDDLHTGKNYDVSIIQIRDEKENIIREDNDINTEQYMNTECVKKYVLVLKACNKSGTVSSFVNLNVYIVKNNIETNHVRFISYEYINTLVSSSKWYVLIGSDSENNLNQILCSSLKRKSGEGLYKISLSKNKVENLKNTVRDNGYIISKEMNIKLSEGW